MAEVSMIGLDIAKQVFHAHGADETGATVFSRRVTRQKLLEFFASQPRCVGDGGLWRGASLGPRAELPYRLAALISRCIISRTDGSIRPPYQTLQNYLRRRGRPQMES